METIKYISPEESKENNETPQHRFDLVVDGVKIGSAEINYYSKPLPFYDINALYVDFEHKGKGYASKIMAQVESWLKDRRKPGVLVDGIIEGDPASGMYKKRGWKEIPNSMGLHVFNWPEDVDLSILNSYVDRYTHLTERQSYKADTNIQNEED